MPAVTVGVPGRLLLTMPGCHVQYAGTEYSGTLALGYDIADGGGGRLVLRVGAFEMPVPPTQPIVRRRARGIYSIPGTPAPATLRVPVAAPNAVARVVLDAFGVLLARFGVVRDANDLEHGPATLGDAQDAEAAAKSIVPVQADPPELRVRALLPEETAAGLLRSAHTTSRGIVLATTTIAAGMALASSAFVARTAPNPAPVVLSATAQRNIAHAHALSADVVAASAHTAELVLHVVDQAAAWAVQSPVPPAPAAPLSVVAPLAPAAPLTGVAALARSADLVLATLAASGAHLMAHGARAVAIGLGHRYGPDVGDAVRVGSAIAHNVGAVHSDARAVGRRCALWQERAAAMRCPAACLLFSVPTRRARRERNLRSSPPQLLVSVLDPLCRFELCPLVRCVVIWDWRIYATVAGTSWRAVDTTPVSEVSDAVCMWNAFRGQLKMSSVSDRHDPTRALLFDVHPAVMSAQYSTPSHAAGVVYATSGPTVHDVS